ncbi:MAG: 30S ribosomal protein S4 [Candidatus Sericytochromatia bacterium]|nr:30S ribosomal protein S4 [Candidatus Sericytochromatia bacterium]
MARYTEPVCRLCRAEGTKLFLKGERCNTGKCAVVRRAYRPGQHGQARQKVSEYGVRLKEKQKMRRIYGILEKQFYKYYDIASRSKSVTGEHMLQQLELRLDNLVYRLGFAPSRSMARQIVRHGHVLVNGRRLDIPSAQIKAGATIVINDKAKAFVKTVREGMGPTLVPAWLNADHDNLAGTVLSVPTRGEIDTSVQENLVIEFYAR